MATLTPELRNSKSAFDAGVTGLDQKLEVMILPVADVERAKQFYIRLGWRVDATPPWVVQITPPGSPASIQFGPNLTSAAPGSASGYLVVSDIVTAREKLLAAGIEASDFVHLDSSGILPGLDPERRSYFTRVTFSDPDGNTWIVQEITSRLPGRVDPITTTYPSVLNLEEALKRAAAAHGQHEKRIGKADPNWPEWYAKYMVAEQNGTTLPE
jgi:catechol 2,3-dioxygenase-like lactoylglutathione lyase family enzyme